jgi:hypothetical protein
LSERLRDLKSSFMHCDQVFLPRSSTFSWAGDLHFGNRIDAGWRDHRSCLMRRASVTFCIPSLAQSNVLVGVSSPGLVLQIHWIIALSFLAFAEPLQVTGSGGAHVLLPCSNAERTHASNVLPLVVKDRCFDVRIGRSFLNFPQVVQHQAVMARVHPPPAHNILPR